MSSTKNRMPRLVLAGLLTLGTTLGIGWTAAAPAAAAAHTCSNGWQPTTWQNTAGLAYLNVRGAGGKGAQVITWSASGESPHTNEKWCLERASEGGWYFHPKYANNLCLDVPGSNYSSGTGLVMWDCNGRKNQRFYVTVPSGQTNHLICPVGSSSTCLAAPHIEEQVVLKSPSYDNRTYWY